MWNVWKMYKKCKMYRKCIKKIRFGFPGYRDSDENITESSDIWDINYKK